MDPNLTLIVTAGTSGITEGLSFDKNISQADFNAATNLAISQLQAAQNSFGQANADTDDVKVEKLVGYGLTIAKGSCDKAGVTKYDALFDVAEDVDTEVETGSFNLINIIKNWIAARKATAAAKTA
jgi:hypothetical protein